ncbi:hypothetical protein [Staphylospora marina]|uniref:hypothetical protein n=1 Tax=Staphylospora marina TaxID=2490858 RepID=UPI000F5BED1E|nr:hypothetical protein [Staphylospora marina]
MIKRILITALAASLIVGVLTGCTDKQEAAAPIHVSFEPNLAGDLKAMSERAQIVVLGKFGTDYHVFNGSRNPQNPAEPSKSVFSEGRSYPFQVIQSIKGQTETDIRVNLLYDQQIDGLLDENGKPLDVRIPSPSFFEPDPSKTYLLFLEKDPHVEGYSINFQPYAIAFDASGKAELITPRKEATALASNEANMKRQVLVHGFVDDYPDTVSGKSIDEVLDEVNGYLK